ncbi:glycoside hydrolase family 43 protein [Lentilactobacillus hilgardii]|uniref:glycoside hydrolase family 43 protein n=1 Tax=Lentilactobacillus hilgardii TaxID=1588 RepID=UPI0021A72A44|nr:glycoside hydrolase family 43 protein [Lentilactobacillus hilgardii]MCT3398793.1 1,4-beta-xylanase [Lentilactobacillus hilgardii]
MDESLPNRYLFVYFAGEKYEDGENIYMALSEDGLNWHDLNHNHPILYSNLGTKGIRYPFIIKDPKNNNYYILATDLKIHGNNDWYNAQRSGSTSLLVWKSSNLINWSAPKLIPVAPKNFGCVWAPEATYASQTEDFLVYWASKTAVDNYAKQRIYCAHTSDFSHFSSPKIYIDRPFSAIDTTIIKNNNRYFRFTKNEAEKYIIEDQLNSLEAKPTEILSPTLTDNLGVEGPTCYPLIGKKKWLLLVDNYAKGGYYPLETTDLTSGRFNRLPTDAYHMPSRARHGTVLPITQNEFNRLID